MARIVMVLIGDIRYDGRVRKEIATLVSAGHDVELVVSDFNKDGASDNDLDIKIHYVPMTLWSNPALNFLEQIWFNRTAASILRKLSPTHIHCHDLTSLLAGVWTKRHLKTKLVFDAHELKPESMGGIRETVWGQIEKHCIAHCDHIIMPEKNRIAYFRKKYAAVQDVLLLENFPRRTDIPLGKHDIFRQLYPISKQQRIVLHTGLIAAKRHVDELVQSIALCGNEFVLVLLGPAFKGYKELLLAKIKDLGVQDRVFLHDPVPHSAILQYMASCDIGTAFYQNTNLNNLYCASNKLYEYIALNKVVLTNNYPGLLEAVGKHRQGICLEEVTPKRLAEAYRQAGDAHQVTSGAKKFFWEDEDQILGRIYQASHADVRVWAEGK